MSILDREYLEDYEQKERSEVEKLEMRIREGKFDFEKDRFPTDDRFVKLQKPVAVASRDSTKWERIWAQVPFCGSLILSLPPISYSEFEAWFFKKSEIPSVIDFIKDTGRLQVVLGATALQYEGLDYLDPFFEELKPPVHHTIPHTIFFNEKEIEEAKATFFTLGSLGFFDSLKETVSRQFGSGLFRYYLSFCLSAYVTLKLRHYTIVEEVEALMVDDFHEAVRVLSVCNDFIVGPLRDQRSKLVNFTFAETKSASVLPAFYRPEEVRFPYEIGKFLLKKLTYAPLGMRACYDVIDHYDDYDLQKIQESMNDAIVTNHPDIVKKNAEDLSGILDNVWNDKTIPKQIKDIRTGVPISIAAIGSAASAFTGGLEGFLAGLGFSVGAKFLDVEIEGLAETVVKFFARSYQANVYDFKKKYKDRITRP